MRDIIKEILEEMVKDGTLVHPRPDTTLAKKEDVPQLVASMPYFKEPPIERRYIINSEGNEINV